MEMVKDIKQAVEGIEFGGYEYIGDRPLSSHPDDWYLRVVLGKNARGYATWLYNAHFKGLFEGHYDMKEHDFNERT